ncbi:hypothetical protein [Algoriphagus hitonicola]|uniref:DUF4382 domain-containing protein n=1 Tax=Algoriphagus hitonicola TaxID=435880 RepID=A0A1I2WT49_9BACT|nr:hypothetical protein [Algoriphagus hitonicola]SFH03867.1 hypothetical protein SAMN04487988_11410 [Algoriphagus hitonicola]
MQNLQKFSLLGAIAMGAFFACTNEEDPLVIGEGDVRIGFGVQLANSGSSNARMAATGLTIESGFIQIKEIELETEGVDENGEFGREIKYDFPEIKKINFSELDSDADFFLNIPSGNYEEIEFEIDLIDHDDEPSIYLEGSYEKSDGSSVPFRLEVFADDDDDLDFEVELEADDEELFFIDAVNNPLALLEIDGQGWFIGISDDELENAELTNGVLVINRNTNTDIYEKVLEKIEDSSEIELELN